MNVTIPPLKLPVSEPSPTVLQPCHPTPMRDSLETHAASTASEDYLIFQPNKYRLESKPTVTTDTERCPEISPLSSQNRLFDLRERNSEPNPSQSVPKGIPQPESLQNASAHPDAILEPQDLIAPTITHQEEAGCISATAYKYFLLLGGSCAAAGVICALVGYTIFKSNEIESKMNLAANILIAGGGFISCTSSSLFYADCSCCRRSARVISVSSAPVSEINP